MKDYYSLESMQSTSSGVVSSSSTCQQQEGFKLLWAGWMEMNSWTSSITLWEIKLVTITSDELQLWAPPAVITAHVQVSFCLLLHCC